MDRFLAPRRGSDLADVDDVDREREFAAAVGFEHVDPAPMPGPAGPIDVLGRRVEALYPIAEVAPRHALRVSALSLDGVLYIGLCADPHVVPDLDALTAGIRLSVDELRDRCRASRPDVRAK